VLRCAAMVARAVVTVLGLASLAAAQTGETAWPRQVGLSGASWSVEVDAAGFAVTIDTTSADGRSRYFMAEQGDRAMGLSVLIQPGPPGATPERCRDLREAGLRSAGFVREEIRTAEAGETAELEYLIPLHQGARVDHRNLWVFRARDGACVEVHVSKTGAGPGDSEALAAVAARARLGQAAAAQAPGAPGPPRASPPAPPADPAAAPAPSARRFPIPAHGQLEVTAPADWRDSLDQPLGGLPPTIAFTPPSGQAFLLQITTLWARGGGPVSSGAVRAMAQSALGRARAQSVEQSASLREVQGPESTGWYFRLTDRRTAAGTLPSGEYAYLVQGAAQVGELVLSFTLLTNDRDGAEHEATVALIRSARQLR